MRPHTLGTVSITQEDKDAVLRILSSGRISPGEITRRFEEEYARAHGHAHGAFVNSGQTALELALVCKNERPCEVVLPATTYISTWAAVLNAGHIPVLCDVGWDFQIDLGKVDLPEGYLLLPVHLYGVSKPYPGPHVIEDACEASYAPYVGRGFAACHSFYTSHIITTGSGGMVTSNEGDFIALVRRMANHGRTEASGSTYVSDALGDVSRNFVFDRVGTSSKGSDLIAALGLSQHERHEALMQKRRMNSNALRRMIQKSNLSCVTLPDCPEGEAFYFQFPLICNTARIKQALVAHLNSHGVQTRDAMPLLTQPVVRDYMKLGDLSLRYPVAWALANQAFHVGIHQDLEPDQLVRFVELLKSFDGGDV